MIRDSGRCGRSEVPYRGQVLGTLGIVGEVNGTLADDREGVGEEHDLVLGVHVIYREGLDGHDQGLGQILGVIGRAELKRRRTL